MQGQTLSDDPATRREKKVAGHPGIYKRDGVYSTRVRDRRGRQRRVTGSTLAEVKANRAAMQTDVARGEWRASRAVTFREYGDDWTKTYTGRSSRGIRPETISDYKANLERHIYPILGGMQLTAIEPRDVRALRSQLEEKGLSAATVTRILAPTKALLATAVEDGILRSNPATGVRPNRQSQTDDQTVKALTEGELVALIEQTPQQWRLLVELLAQTGLRIGELVALRWSDVDFAERCIRIERRYYRGRFDAPKSRCGKRAVRITAEMTQRLWQGRKAAENTADTALVFTNRDGGYLDAKKMHQQWLKPAAKRAGVPWAGFHTLRHTNATMLFRHGWNAAQVSLHLGHHSASFTLSRYVHLLESDMPELPAAFTGNALGNIRGTRAAETSRDEPAPVGSEPALLLGMARPA